MKNIFNYLFEAANADSVYFTLPDASSASSSTTTTTTTTDLTEIFTSTTSMEITTRLATVVTAALEAASPCIVDNRELLKIVVVWFSLTVASKAYQCLRKLYRCLKSSRKYHLASSPVDGTGSTGMYFIIILA